MDKIELETMEVDVKRNEAVIQEAYSTYGFEFTIDGMACRTWYDQEHKAFAIMCPYKGEKLLDLTAKVDRLIYEVREDFDIRDVRKFLCKHFDRWQKSMKNCGKRRFRRGP
jgi:hypothetical protein